MDSQAENQLKEQIIRVYAKTLDLDLAFKIVKVKDREALLSDEVFQSRLAYEEAKRKEKLLENLFELADNAKTDSVRLGALMEIMKTYYPERFGKDKDKSDDVEQIILYLPENNRDGDTT